MYEWVEPYTLYSAAATSVALPHLAQTQHTAQHNT